MVTQQRQICFFQSWAKDVQAIVIDRQMSDNEALQLIKEHTEGTARHQVDNYLDFSDNQTFFRINEGVVNCI